VCLHTLLVFWFVCSKLFEAWLMLDFLPCTPGNSIVKTRALMHERLGTVRSSLSPRVCRDTQQHPSLVRDWPVTLTCVVSESNSSFVPLEGCVAS
jgi:hypothetical protein